MSHGPMPLDDWERLDHEVYEHVDTGTCIVWRPRLGYWYSLTPDNKQFRVGKALHTAMAAAEDEARRYLARTVQ